MRALLAAVGVVIAASAADASDFSSKVDSWRTAHEREVVGKLAELISTPSVAANPQGLAAMADRLRTELASRGFEARLIGKETGATPVIYGYLATPGAQRTVVFYAHYDSLRRRRGVISRLGELSASPFKENDMANLLPIAFALIAVTTQANQPQMVTAPAGGPETKYCLRVDPLPGSRIETIQCKTRDEWALLEVDVDQEWTENGVKTIA